MVNDVKTELFYDGAWNDISTDVRQDPGHTIKWGRADESGKAAPATLDLTLDNTNGKYSPRNPTGVLYGKIGRNTPIRARLGAKAAALTMPGHRDSGVSTPDHASLDIVGDIDIRIEVDPTTWRLEDDPFFGFRGLARKWTNEGDQRSWALWFTRDGILRIRWSPDGTLTSAITVSSSVAVPEDAGRLALAVLVDVDNGAGGNTTTFFTAPAIDGSYTQLGDAVVNSGTTSFHSGSAPLEVGRTSSPESNGVAIAAFDGRIYGFELRNGHAGTVVANLDFTTEDPETREIEDDQGRDWTIHGVAGIVDDSVRMASEVTSWPPRWSLSGADVVVPVEASGIRRRLEQGAKALRSSLTRDLSTKDNVVAYWPMEDGADANSFASGIGHGPMRYFGAGTSSPASFTEFIASEALPTWDTLGFSATVPSYTADNEQRLICLFHVPEGGMAAERTFLSLHTTGTVTRWNVTCNQDGALRMRWFGSDGELISESAPITFDVNGKLLMFSVSLAQEGADVNWGLLTLEVGSTAATAFNGTATNRTFGRVRKITGGSGAGLSNTAIGQVALFNGDIDSFWDLAGSSLVAWTGELARERIVRLCAEEGVPLRQEPARVFTPAVGPQTVSTFLDLIDTAAATDPGSHLGDDRSAVRLLYRPGRLTYNRDVALTLDYGAGEVASSLEPTEDDQATRNDVTVKRPEGSSAQVIRESGPMSIQDPPAGVGRYEESRTINVDTDLQVPQQASWLLNLGTVNEARYPQISVDLTAAPSLATAAMSVHPGDRVQITDPPAWLPPGTIDQIVQGGEERLTPYRHNLRFNCSPAAPWTVLVVGPDDPAEAGEDQPNRVDTAGSELDAAVTDSATTFDVVTTVSERWIDSVGFADDFPFLIRVGGEVMRVTAISGTTTTQGFTVERSINGVVKAHAAGTAVSLAVPARLAL